MNHVEKAKELQKESYESIIAEKDAIIKELSAKLAHATAIINRNDTNTGISTAATPINEKKVIPNTRRGSGKAKGGQPGHEKHMLSAFDESEITQISEHELDLSVEDCDKYHGELFDTGEVENKDEFDVKVTVIKHRHKYHVYECKDCGYRVRLPIEKTLKELNQYGCNLQATALSLMVTGNVAINKVRMLIHGMTSGQMLPSEGYICKLYKRAALALTRILDRPEMPVDTVVAIIYWMIRLIMIRQIVLHEIYGDETISYYTAHRKKDLESLLKDNVLPLLTEENTVMHDHNKVNYNGAFAFKNIECNQHLERDLQKVADDNPEHTWLKK